MLAKKPITRIKDKTVCERMKILLVPFVDYENNDETGVWSITLIPEAFRVWTYVIFYAFSFIAMVTSVASGAYHPKDNPIYNTFGNDNICVFYDDPPFSYFGAALWNVEIFCVWLYVITDVNRIYFNMATGKHKQLTPTFYRFYKYASFFVGFSFSIFIQCLSTQPTQNMTVHWTPFAFLMWAMWLEGVQHFVYMLKIGIISKGTQYYAWGIIYIILMAISVTVKFLCDFLNVGGADLLHTWGAWFGPFATLVDASFMFLLSVCPVFVYLIFVDELDHVRYTFSNVMCIDAHNEMVEQQQKKEEERQQEEAPKTEEYQQEEEAPITEENQQEEEEEEAPTYQQEEEAPKTEENEDYVQ